MAAETHWHETETEVTENITALFPATSTVTKATKDKIKRSPWELFV